MTFTLYTSQSCIGWNISAGELQTPSLMPRTVEGAAHGARAVQGHTESGRDVSRILCLPTCFLLQEAGLRRRGPSLTHRRGTGAG